MIHLRGTGNRRDNCAFFDHRSIFCAPLFEFSVPVR
jgi:hypothetical protein